MKCVRLLTALIKYRPEYKEIIFDVYDDVRKIGDDRAWWCILNSNPDFLKKRGLKGLAELCRARIEYPRDFRRALRDISFGWKI